MLNAFLNIVLASNYAPAQTELYLTKYLSIESLFSGCLKRDGVLERRLLVLLLLVVAFAFQQVQRILVIRLHLTLRFRQAVDSLVDFVLLV